MSHNISVVNGKLSRSRISGVCTCWHQEASAPFSTPLPREHCENREYAEHLEHVEHPKILKVRYISTSYQILLRGLVQSRWIEVHCLYSI